jgi:hypothetical protein
MKMKLVRVTDGKIRINTLAIKFSLANEMEREILVELAGHRADGGSVLLVELDREVCTTEPVKWASMGIFPRTLPVVHEMLLRSFDHFEDGRVNIIDVEKVLNAQIDPCCLDGRTIE